MVTHVSPDDFMSETRRWGITSDSLIRVRMMKKRDMIYFRFTTPNSGEVIQTRIPFERFNDFDFMDLYPISIPAIFEETSQVESIKKLMEEINAKPEITAFNRSNSIQYG